MRAPAEWMLRGVLLAALLAASDVAAAARPLQLVAEFESSRELRAGSEIRSGDVRIGTVRSIGFGKDVVEVRLEIDPAHRGEVRKSSTFVVLRDREDGAPWVEHFVLDAASPPADDDDRVRGARSVAEVWIRRGRVTSEELGRVLSRGADDFRRQLEELQRSEEWARLRDQTAKLAAELTVTGSDLARLLEEQLPKLQQQLDDFYRRYEEELSARKK